MINVSNNESSNDRNKNEWNIMIMHEQDKCERFRYGCNRVETHTPLIKHYNTTSVI